MHGLSPELKDKADSERHGYALAVDVMAEQHIDNNMHDPAFIDESLSDYCFLSANAARESEYRQALFQIYHNHDSGLMIQLISKAMLEKSRREVNKFVANEPTAAAIDAYELRCDEVRSEDQAA